MNNPHIFTNHPVNEGNQGALFGAPLKLIYKSLKNNEFKLHKTRANKEILLYNI